MTIRSDLTIDWATSPRNIEVTSDVNELTVQDIYDTLRNLAALPEAMDNLEIVDGGGKDGGIVAITVILKNAQVRFKDTGMPRLCKIHGGNLFAVDEDNHDMSPIGYKSNITVAYAQSTAPALVIATEEWTGAEKTQILSDVAFIRQVEQGRWKIVNNQLIFYESNGVSPLITFNLKSKTGQPAETDVFERVPL